jgi:hypothetical protein
MNINELNVYTILFLKKLTLQYFSVVRIMFAVPLEEIGSASFTTMSSLSIQ